MSDQARSGVARALNASTVLILVFGKCQIPKAVNISESSGAIGADTGNFTAIIARHMRRDIEETNMINPETLTQHLRDLRELMLEGVIDKALFS